MRSYFYLNISADTTLWGKYIILGEKVCSHEQRDYRLAIERYTKFLTVLKTRTLKAKHSYSDNSYQY